MSAPRFDGLYLCRDDAYLSWLRFYEDGLVLQVTTSAATPEQVARWMHPTHPHLWSGRWSLDDDRLTFTATNSYGSVEYDGYVQGDTLVLGYVSRINGHRGQGEWSFHPLASTAAEAPPEAAP